MTDTTTKKINQTLAIKFFATALAFSGCAALAYQVVWQRVLTQVIGSDSISIVLIISIFMICLGIGSELARKLLQSRNLNPLKTYAIIEVAVGVYGIFSISLLRHANEWFANFRTDSVVADFLLNLGLLAVPIIGMGLTTPLVVHVAKRELSNIGRTVGVLYGFNLAGAAAGAFLTGLLLIELFALTGTAVFAACLNFIAASIAYFTAKKSSTPNHSESALKGIPIPLSPSFAAMMFGFGTLAIQMIFFRILSNYFTLSTIVFPIVLCAYLCLMAIGQWAGGKLADTYSSKLPLVIAVLFSLGSLLFLFALRFPAFYASKIGALRFTSFNGGLIDQTTHGHLIGDPPVLIAFFFSMIFMASVITWSGLFPVMIRLFTSDVKETGSRFARIYTLYTIGNVAGAFVCGIYLLPSIGTADSSRLTILVVGLGVLILASRKNTSKLMFITLAGCSLTFLIPQDYYKTFKLDDYYVSDVFEGKTGVVTVAPTSRFYNIIDINRTASASALIRDPGPDDLYEAWRWNHTELMALDSNFRPKRVLVIGIGHAYLIDALLDIESIEHIDVVDISQEIVAAVQKYSVTSTKRIFNDPRVNIVISDGRRFVQSAVKHGERYDLIQTKINEPWHAGGGNLFTIEFFSTQKKLLTYGGYLGVRPLLGHLNDGLKVFDTAVWPGYYHLFFKNGDFELPKQAVVSPDIRDAWSKNLPGTEPSALSDRQKLSVALFKVVPTEMIVDNNTDNRPTFEYYWYRKLIGTWKSPQKALWDFNMKSFITDVPVYISK
jgi:spermidine synthase